LEALEFVISSMKKIISLVAITFKTCRGEGAKVLETSKSEFFLPVD
jgi:hypothetical protein